MTLPLADGRRNFNELFVSLALPNDWGTTEDRTVPGPAGPVPVRVFRSGEADPQPLVAFFHGGGWVFGDLDSYDSMCRTLARTSGAVVVSVDYRLAPENPFPAGFEDCWAVTRWLASSGHEIGGQADQIAVAGDSAGGNLAAAVALRARDEAVPPLRAQLLMYPALDPAMSSASYEENAEDPFLSRSEMEWSWPRYLGAITGEAVPYAAPAYATDLAGVAPAVILVAGHDPLRDEAVAYADRLRAAGVPVELERYEDMVHGFLSFSRSLDVARKALEDAGQALGRLLDATGSIDCER
jgi:acetyl esterase